MTWSLLWEKLGLQKVSVPGDGNCLFHSFSLILFGTLEHHHVLRQLAVSHRLRMCEYNAINPIEHTWGTQSNYELCMRRSRYWDEVTESYKAEWGTYEEAFALADAFGCKDTLFVWTSHFEDFSKRSEEHGNVNEVFGFHLFFDTLKQHWEPLIYSHRKIFSPDVLLLDDPGYNNLSSNNSSHTYNQTVTDNTTASTSIEDKNNTSMNGAQILLRCNPFSNYSKRSGAEKTKMVDPLLNASCTARMTNGDGKCSDQNESDVKTRARNKRNIIQITAQMRGGLNVLRRKELNERNKIRNRLSKGPKPAPANNVLAKEQQSLQRFGGDSECQDIEDFEAELAVSCNMMICCSCGERLSTKSMRDELFLPHHPLLTLLRKQYFPTNEDSSGKLCNRCYEYLLTDILPPYSKANGFDFGDLPFELQGLTWAEQKLISLVTPIFTIISWPSDPRVKNMKGHVINLRNDINEVAKSLPLHPDQSGAYVYQIASNGSGRLYCPLSYRPEKVTPALKWFKLNNPLYRDVTILTEENQKEMIQAEIAKRNIILEEQEKIERAERERLEDIYRETGHVDSLPSTHESVYRNEGFANLPSCSTTVEGPGEYQLAEMSHIFIHEEPSSSEPATNRKRREANLSHPKDSHYMRRLPSSGPVNEYVDKNLILSCFPYLFPYGRGGPGALDSMNSGVRYMRHLFRFHDGRFARHKPLIFWCLNHLLRRRVDGLSVAVERAVMNNTIRDPLEGITIPSAPSVGLSKSRNMKGALKYNQAAISIQRTLMNFTRAVPGTTAAMRKHKQEVLAQVNATSLPVPTPTFFFTLSSSDRSWPQLYRMIDPNLTDERLSNLSRAERNRLLTNNPVLAAQHFYDRFEAYKKFVLNGRSKALGTVVDFVYRIEFQGRGSLHVHGLIWCKELKNVLNLLHTRDGQEEVRSFCDRIIRCDVADPHLAPINNIDTRTDGILGIPQFYLEPTARLPLANPQQQQRIETIVKLTNVHVHQATCLKKYRQCKNNPRLVSQILDHLNHPNNRPANKRGRVSDDATDSACVNHESVASTNDRTSHSTVMDKFQCRFHYPKRLCSQTRLSFINPCFVEDKRTAEYERIESPDINDYKFDVSNTSKVNVKKLSQKRNLEFEFRRNHCMLNNYNELTALLWKGNHDVSPVCNPWGTAVYIAKYVTKAEESEDPALTDRIMRALTKLGENGNTNGRRIAAQIRAAGKADIGFHEFGLQEAVWLIMGRPLVEQSREIVKVDVGSRWCPTGEVTISNPNSEYDLLETDNVLAHLNRNGDGSNNKSIECSLTKDQYAARIRHLHSVSSNGSKIAGAGSKRGLELAYQNRPAELEQTNFHTFLSEYRGLEIRPIQENEKHPNSEKDIRLRPGQMLVYIPDNLNGVKIPRLLIRRTREAVVYPTPRLDWDINTNQACFAILLLYVAWREYDKIVINNDPVQTLQSKIDSRLISEDIIQMIKHQKSISDSLKQDRIEREERRLKRMEKKAFEIRKNMDEAEVDEDSDGENLSELSGYEATSDDESEDESEQMEQKISEGSIENSSSEIHECNEVSVRKYKALSRWLKDWVARRSKIEMELIEARCRDVNMNGEQRLNVQETRNSVAMNTIQKMIDNLNELQQCAFKLVGNAVWRDPEMLRPDEQAPPLNLIILGSGGTGKSFFIKTLDAWIRTMYSMLPEIDANMTKRSNNFRVEVGDKKYQVKLRESMQYAPLLILAFTGGAAYAVRGRTLHSAFGFNPKSGDNELSKDQKRNMRWRFLKVKVIVIDEVSMVQADMLLRIDRRLRDLFPEFEKIPFGGRHMILCGDFYQLPPVCARGIYYRHPSDANGGNRLYERFTKVIIFEQQKRQNNPVLISLLERARTGTITHEDIELLNQRLIIDPRYNATCKILQPNELNSYNESEREEEPEDINNNSLYGEEEGEYGNNDNYNTDENNCMQHSKYLDLKPPVNCMACTYTNAIADAHNMTTHIRSVNEGKKRLYRIWAVHTANMKAQPAVDISNDSQINMSCNHNDKQIVRKMPLVRSPMNASIKLALLRNSLFDSKGVNQKREKAKLSNCLNLNIGARVMLTHNMATSLGLVNGSMGIVKGFVYCKSSWKDKCNDREWTATKMSQRENSHQLPVVLVKFDEEYFEHPGYCGENGVVPIYPIKEDIMYQGNSYRRTQLPLILAWSLTIHRTQGRTLDHLVVDPPKTEGNKPPPRGLMYVAISRVRQLKGLFLYSPLTMQMFNSQENDIQLVNKEMERLREFHQQTVIEAQSLPMPSTGLEENQGEEIDIE